MEARFGKYVIESEIGRGGFGRVYSAFDADMNRRVAIKELDSESDPDLLSRFHAEAGTTASLNHKNIITVYDYSQQNGRPYLVMELLNGKTLLEIVGSENSPPLLEKVETMYQVGEGLQYAHARGVIHRDIKPGNIMVLPNGEVKIMDFGIARLLGNTAPRKTREGDLIGTVLYMAPESFRKYETDARTDIFSYGVLFYEFLTGRHPFSADDAVAIMNRIMYDEAEPIMGQVEGCPQSLDLLIQRLMMKDPETRFDDLADVLFDMEPILRQLRHERANELAKLVEPRFEVDDNEWLQPRVKQILALDPRHERGLAWQNTLRERMNRKRAEKLGQQGVEHMNCCRFREAALCFEGALHLDPNKPEIAKLLEEANASLNRVKRSAQLVSDARSERQSGNLDRAFRALSEAVDLDPANREAAQLRDSLHQQMRELEIAARLGECRDLALEGRYDEAIGVLERLGPELLQRPDIAEIRIEIVEEKREAEHQRRRAKFRQEIQAARQLLRERNWEQATAAADELCRQYPDEPLAAEFREDVWRQFAVVQRADALAALQLTVQPSIEQNRFDEATAAIETCREKLGPDPAIDQLLEKVRAASAEYQRTVMLERVMQRTEELAAEGNLEGALQLLRKAIQKFGEHPPFRTREAELAGELERREQAALAEQERLLAEIEARRPPRVIEPPRMPETRPSQERKPEKKMTREEAIADGREKASGLARAGDLPGAVARLEALSKRYPNSSEVRRDLAAAAKELEYQQQLMPAAKKVRSVVSMLRGLVSKDRK